MYLKENRMSKKKYEFDMDGEGLSAVNALLIKDSKEGFSLLGEYFRDLWW